MDNKTLKGATDRARISLSEEYEVRYWTEALKVSEEELKALVKEHGNSADTVRKAAKELTRWPHL